MLNRPEKLNALSRKLQEELLDAARMAEEDRDVRVVVLRGNGECFSVGYDISPDDPQQDHEARENIRADIVRLRRLGEQWNTLWKLSKPVIAQVHGYCLAGGTDLAFNCDMIVAAEDAVFGFPAVRALGSPPTHMWVYLVGPQWAKYFLLTGAPADGRTAERIGLVWKAVAADELDEEVEALATAMAKIPWELLAANKGICNRAIDLMGRSLLQELAAESDAIAHQSDVVRDFHRIAKEEGLKAALAWMHEPFGDYRSRRDG